MCAFTYIGGSGSGTGIRRIVLAAAALAFVAITAPMTVGEAQAQGSECEMEGGATNDANPVGVNSFACGESATALLDRSTALGSSSQALGEDSTAVGFFSRATGLQSTALGEESFAQGDRSTALGEGSHAQGGQSTAVGQLSQATGINSVAVGADGIEDSDTEGAQAIGANSTALGADSLVTTGATNSVALGANSVADEANTVSVGSVGAERRMTNVAAGINDTDAVNVSQLQSVESHLGNRIDEVSDVAESAGALGLAAAALRFDDRAGKFSLAAGAGAFEGAGAFAVGAGYTSMDQRWRLNVAGGGAPENDDFGVNAGVSFTLN